MSRLRLTAMIAALIGMCASSAWCASGSVVDSAGKPIAGAKILVFVKGRRDIKPATVLAGADGKFTFEPKTKGTLWYLAAADGYARSAIEKGADSKDPVDFKLLPAIDVTGQVVDADGKPVPGVKVTVRRFSGWDNSGQEAGAFSLPAWTDPTLAVTTDTDGRFTLPNVPDPAGFQYSDLSLSAIAPGRALIERSIQGSQLASEIKLIEPMACSVSGTVYLPGKTGPAPEGTRIAVEFAELGAGTQGRTTSIDKGGKFTFRDLPPGPVSLMLTSQQARWNKEGTDLDGGVRQWALPAITDLELTPKQSRSVEMVMVPGALIRGKVMDKATGKPASGGAVNVEHAGRSEGAPEQAMISKNGEFMLRVAPGKVSLSIYYCQVGDQYVNFDDESESPKVELAVADGGQSSDAVLQVDSTASRNDYEAQGKPVPADFELKPGTYTLAWDPEVKSTGDGYSTGGCADAKAKAKIAKLPALKSKKPLYMGYRFDGPGDDGLLLVIFDESRGTAKGYDTAYVDSNRNRDLTDDSPIKWRATRNYKPTPWTQAQARFGTRAERCEHTIALRWRLNEGMPMGLERKGGWSGTLDSNKGPVKTVLFDWNSNGRCDDRSECGATSGTGWPAFKWGDCVFVDTNGFGKAVPQQWGPHALTQGGLNVIGESGCTITANSSGSTITVAPYTGLMGKLELRADDIAGFSGPATFLNIAGNNRVYNYSDIKSKTITLPVGSYFLGYCSFGLAKGEEKFSVAGNYNRPVVIKAGEQTTVSVTGQPRLAILPDKVSVTFEPGKESPIAWGISIGDSLKGVYLNGSREEQPAKVAFDSSDQFLKVKAAGGG